MDNRKEEILAKSRQAKQDEGKDFIKNKGAKLGLYCALAVMLPMYVMAIITEQWFVVGAGIAVFCATDFGSYIARYRVLKRKRDMIAAIILAICGVAATVYVIRGLVILHCWTGC